jgi:hypothetical protein
MIVGIQGTKAFNDYNIFLRGMGAALGTMTEEDKEFFIYSAGPANLNSMGLEFSNISERSLKARGIKIKFFKIPPSWIKENIHSIDYFAFFSRPKETESPLVKTAQDKDIEVAIYRY